MTLYLIAVLAITAAADAWSTIRFLKEGRREGKPIGRWFHATFGNVPGSILAKVLQVVLVGGGALLIDHFFISPLVVTVVIILNIYVTLDNLDWI